MPQTRPAEISDGVSLSDKVGAAVLGFVSEHGAVDALLSAAVDESAPNKEGISFPSAQTDIFARTDELFSSAPDAAFETFPTGIVSFIQIAAYGIGIFRNPPNWRTIRWRGRLLSVSRQLVAYGVAASHLSR